VNERHALGIDRWLADRLAGFGALDARPRHAGENTFDDDRALELGEHAEHLKESPTSRCGGVDCLPFEVEIDTGAIKLTQEANEVLQATTEAIDAPSGDDINPAPCDILKQSIEMRPPLPTLGPADAVIDVLVDHAPPARFACR
jgi:hypothetical protein